VPVQGNEAPELIAGAIEMANARGECDVLIVARGGGSLEDLWAFNDERTVRAISASTIPIVCGVGHEVDFTISDFVADLRAATPTAAAEAVTPDGAALALRVRGHAGRLTRAMSQRLATQQRQLQTLRHRLQHPATRLQQLAQHADLLTLRLQRAAERRLQTATSAHASYHARLALNDPAQRIVRLRLRLRQAVSAVHTHMEHQLEQRQSRVRAILRELHAIGPSATLTRGYAIATDAVDGAVLRRAATVEPGAQINVRLAAGVLRCTVDETLATPPTTSGSDSATTTQ
jgi:exodeoxyribonuclease VII large subunit